MERHITDMPKFVPQQLGALAAPGFHAVVPDMRGYGQTDAPQEIDRYTLLHLLGDMVGLLAFRCTSRSREPGRRSCCATAFPNAGIPGGIDVRTLRSNAASATPGSWK